MRRKYTRKEYIDFIEQAHRQVPQLSIGTDVLLGTPSETEMHFQDTVTLLRDYPLDYAHAFTYSEREGTTDQRKTQIPYDERKRRTQIIRDLSVQKKSEMGARFLNQTCQVLFEENNEGFWQGYTPQYLRVKIKSNSNLQNQIREVNIHEVCGEWVLGSLVEQSATVP
jgi:threonylcarbamoyladenosine tRNA methylthiotransferase MtaB